MSPTSQGAPHDPAARLALALVAILAVVWSCQPIAHDDVFWHIRTGEWIASHHAVPLHDSFSFTRAGARWITHEWGFSCLAAAAFHLGGFPGLFALTALTVLGTGWAVWRRSAAEPFHPTVAAVSCALALLAVRSLVFLRPALVGELVFALSLLLTDRYRETPTHRRLAGVLAVFWVWANVHSGVIFGLFVLGLRTLETFLPASITHDAEPRRQRKGMAIALGGAAALCLLNPNGFDLVRFPFLLNRVFFHSGIAWDLGQFEAYAPGRNSALILLVLLLLWGILRAAPRSRPRPWEIVAMLAFLVMSLRASRFLFSVAILLVPATARVWASAGEEGRRPSRWRWLAAGAVGAAIALALVRSPVRWPLRSVDRWLPAGAAKFIADQRLTGHMFHHANHGGYLYFALGQPIFWDGRNDVFWDLTREVGTTDFRVLERRYDIDMLVLTHREYDDLREEAEGPAWALVYWDDAAAVYLRRDRFPQQIAALELTRFRGFGGGADEVKTLAQAPTAATEARAELDRLLAFWPENQRALYLLGVLDFYGGDFAGARTALERALALGSNELLEKTLAAVDQAAARSAAGAAR